MVSSFLCGVLYMWQVWFLIWNRSKVQKFPHSGELSGLCNSSSSFWYLPSQRISGAEKDSLPVTLHWHWGWNSEPGQSQDSNDLINRQWELTGLTLINICIFSKLSGQLPTTETQRRGKDWPIFWDMCCIFLWRSAFICFFIKFSFFYPQTSHPVCARPL